VKLYVGAPGGASVPTFYELRVDDDPVPYADGAATVVFIDMNSQKSRRIPEDIRARLERAQAPA
jgi:acyl-CoA thioesterase FadM